MEKNTSMQASDLIWSAWRGGKMLDSVPGPLKPASRAEGYAIQACLEARSKQAVYGWKIAATSLAGQQHIGVAGPLAGRILAEQVLPAGATVSLRGNHMRLAECEFAFRMATTLLPRAAVWQQDEVMQAVASLHPAIELPDTRFVACETVGEALLIADNACGHQFMLGQAAPASWRELDLAQHPVQARVHNDSAAASGGDQVHRGQGRNVLGDPRIALTWLVNELSQLGIALQAGAVVTTGTCVIPIPVVPGDEVTVDFASLGSIQARFTD